MNCVTRRLKSVKIKFNRLVSIDLIKHSIECQYRSWRPKIEEIMVTFHKKTELASKWNSSYMSKAFHFRYLWNIIFEIFDFLNYCAKDFSSGKWIHCWLLQQTHEIPFQIVYLERKKLTDPFQESMIEFDTQNIFFVF